MKRTLAQMNEEEFQFRLKVADLSPKFKAAIIKIRKKQLKEIKEENETKLPHRIE